MSLACCFFISPNISSAIEIEEIDEGRDDVTLPVSGEASWEEGVGAVAGGSCATLWPAGVLTVGVQGGGIEACA